jgi:hypothetical protein
VRQRGPRIAVHLADPEVIGRAISRASEELRASIDGPHWFVTSANPARLEAARQAAADAKARPRRTLPASARTSTA